MLAPILVLALAIVLVVQRSGSDGGSGSSGDGLEVVSGVTEGLGAGVRSEPEELWTFEADGFIADVAENDGSMAVLSSDGEGTEFEGEVDSTITVLDRSSGDDRWSEDIDGSPNLVRPLDDGFVVVSGSLSSDGETSDSEVTAFTESGEERWSWSDELAIYSVDRVEEGLLLRGYDDESRVVLLTTDGDERWSEAGFLAGVRGSIAILDDSDAGEVRAVEMSDGDEIWSEDVDGGVGLAGNTVLITDGDDLEGRSVTNGDDLDLDSSVDLGELYGFQAAPGDRVVAYGEDGIAAIDPRGTTLWDSNHEGSSVTVGDKLLHILEDGDADLTRVDPSDGDELADETFSDSFVYGESEDGGGSQNPFATDVVYVRSEDEVTAVDLSTLEELWSVDVDGDFVGSLWALPGQVAVINGDGELVALG